MEFLRQSLWLCLLLGLVSGQQSRSRAISSSASSGSSTPVDFDCPEEFGYYPHPSDCTQYYVCVFGGALLESCTGGLVYSHELQTCDWPRNVECIPGHVQISDKSRSQASTARPKVDLRTRKPGNVPPVASNVPISNEERFTSSISHPFANSGNTLPEREPQRLSSSRPLTFLEDDLQLQEEFDANRQSRLFRLQNSNNAQPDGRKVGGAFNNKQQTIAREPERPTFENRQPTSPQQSVRDQEEFTHATSSRPSAPQFFSQFPPSSQFPQEGSRDAFFQDQSKFETPQTTPPVRPTAPQVHSESEVIPEDESGASNVDDFTTFATESPTTLTRQTATEETHNLRDRPKQQTTFQEPATHNGNQFLVQTQFAPDVRDDDFDSWGSQFQTTTRQQQLQLQQQKQQQQQLQKQHQSQPTHRPRPIPDHFFENAPEERPTLGIPARPKFQFEEVVTKPPQAPVRISRPSTEAPVSLFDQNEEQFSRPRTPAPVSAPEEVFHSVEETDADYEDFEAAAVPEEHNQNWQSPQSEEVFTEEVTETRTTTTTTTTTTTPAPTTRRTTTKPTTATTTTTTTTPRPSRQPSRTEEKSRGSTRHQASKPVASSDDEDVPPQPPKRGSSRPNLKTDVIASKAEPFDVSKFPPSRPAPRFAQPRVGDSAAKCNSEVCQLPDCYCGGKEIPGKLKAERTPQIVLLTFDDSVNDLNKELYKDLFESGRKNPNGCPIAATFYVSHEWTDYGQVQSLYADGHEIASHTISHSFGEQFSAKKWAREAAGQRDILAAYGGVKPEDIRGLRAPFLSIGGNNMFKMLYDMNFTYDSSMPVYENKPPSWPYTLDYKIFHDCMIPPCPTKSYPGVWEVPMVMWQDLNGGRCSMGDGCSNPPDAEGVYKMLIKNFERHYTSNRAPFPLYYHAAWFTTPHHKEGFEAFLDTIVAMDDVWLVTNWQAIQWVREPTSLEKIKSFKPFGCDYPDRPKRCNSPKVCNSWHKSGVRYMRTCQACPDVFPWTGKTGVRDLALDTYEED